MKLCFVHGLMQSSLTCFLLVDVSVWLEVPVTEYEKERAENIMRNNQMLKSLGVTALASLVNSSHGKGRGRAAEQSRLHESDRNNDHMANKVSGNEHDLELTRNTSMPAGSKRVMVLDEQDIPARRTRQRTRATQEGLQGDAQDDALVDADLPTEHDEIEMCNEGQSNALVHRSNRGRTMGKELDRLSRGLNTKIQVHVAEGKRRPDAPMQAAKLASESGIILRNHIPILPHWKDYKDGTHLKELVGKVAAQFAIDIEDKAVKNACTDLLKGGQRQQRHRLKKTFFDNVPANEVPTTSPVTTMTDGQWGELVRMWSCSKHKEKCVINKKNREKVQFHQSIGSRSFIAHAHVLKQQEKYKDVEPDAIDMFEGCHTGTKTGMSEAVKDALEQMKAIVNEPAPEGEAPKTPAEAVAQVLPSKTFLRNVGLDTSVPKRSSKARVHELEAQVEAEKQRTADLKEKFEALDKEVMESEAAREKEREEMAQARNKE